MAATPPRWQRRKDARPAEILDAALDVFAERGFTATRMDDVAARAGVTKGTVYLYFKNKEELFKALVRAELLPNLAAVEGAADTVPAGALMERLVHMWIDRVLPSRVGVLPKLIIAEAGNFPELAKFYLHEVVHRGLALVRRVITRGVTAGDFRPVDVDQVAYLVIAPLLLTVLWKHSFGPHDDRPMDAPALIRAHLDVLLNGLKNSDRPAARGRRNGTRK
jgi:AcrR family transcriptional regulator